MKQAEASATADADRGQSGIYSVWAYEHDRERQPILVVTYEWERAGLKGVRIVGAWLSESWLDENDRWEDIPEFNTLSCGAETSAFAELIEQGAVRRIGSVPPLGSFAQPSS
jgi:hypothetical protein